MRWGAYFTDRKGSAIILAAAMLPLLMICMGITIDAGRYYVVQAKAQTASDAALLGAVATSSTTDVNMEMRHLFNANFPSHYMGVSLSDINVTTVGASYVYQSSFTVTVPMVVMRLFGTESAQFEIISQVTKGFEIEQRRKLELALVLDNTGSMADDGKMEALKLASRELLDILFGNSNILQNLHVSIVPYDAMVNIGPDRPQWVQGQYVDDYELYARQGYGFVANRNGDGPINEYNDLTDNPPETELLRFRVPTDLNSANCSDLPDNTIGLVVPISFAINSKSALFAQIDQMTPTVCTRINVGLMWGWFTLSPKWRGFWDKTRLDLPADSNEWLDKALVLMTDGQNTVFLGGDPLVTDDNEMTRRMCNAIKAQGITIYTVGLGSGEDISEELMQECASQPNYYFHAPTGDDLRNVFKQIADDLLYSTIHLSK